MTEENTARVERQKTAPITVIIGNPPYNVGQINENDNNKNRKYTVIDQRIRLTYARDSKASNVNALSDAYVKFFRWAVERLEDRDGIVCFVSNNSFVDQITFDGMRKNLLRDFTTLYHADLHGNVRKNPKLNGTTHNVFGIQVGVGITVAIRQKQSAARVLFYHRVPEDWRKEEKLSWLAKKQDVAAVEWQTLQPDESHTWRIPAHADVFKALIPIGSREAKAGKTTGDGAIFTVFSIGVNTNRDAWVYCFEKEQLAVQVQRSIETYNGEIDRWKRAGRPHDIDNFIDNDETRIKWSSRLKETFVRGLYAEFEENKIRNALWRPFTKRFLFFDSVMNHRQALFPSIFPNPVAEEENRLLCISGPGSEKPFMALMSNQLLDYHLVGAGAQTQCFPFYVYDEEGGNRRENITEWALSQFRRHYAEASISKWDIFYYAYGLLHHPGYRDLLVANTEQGHDRLLIGYAAIVPSRSGPTSLFSHHIYRLRLRPLATLTPDHLCHLLNTQGMHALVSGYATGTTVNMLPLDALQLPRIVVPCAPLVAAFDRVARGARERQEQILEEVRTLAALRDTLLPKLLSGQIRVRDAAAQTSDLQEKGEQGQGR